MLIDGHISQMLSVSEVASMLHVHSNTLRQWTNEGLIRAYRIGKRGDRRFAREDVAAFLEKLNKENRLL